MYDCYKLYTRTSYFLDITVTQSRFDFGRSWYRSIQSWLNFMFAPILLSSLIYRSVAFGCLSAYVEILPRKRYPPKNGFHTPCKEGEFVTLTVHVLKKLYINNIFFIINRLKQNEA